MKRNFYLGLILLLGQFTNAQTDREKVEETLNNYMNGTSYNEVDQIKKAFYPDANLYLTKKDGSLWVVPSKEYCGWFEKGEKGKFNGRVSRIESIEIFHEIAMARVEVLIPHKNLRYVDMMLLKKLGEEWKIVSKSAASETSNKNGQRILFVLSNAQYYGDSKIKTGNSMSEIVKAYSVFWDEGYTVDFVTPEGGSASLAYFDMSDSLQRECLNNAHLMYQLKHTKSPDMIKSEDYKAVYYVGGGSAMYGVPNSEAVQRVVMEIYEKNKGIVSAVCHGTAGIVHLKTSDGKYLVDGKKISGYPDEYERHTRDYYKQFPFKMDDMIKEHGGTFKYSARNTPHIEIDNRVITGQNHLSAGIVAQEIVKYLQKAKK